MNTNLQPTITLNNGVKIPQLGLGVWKTPLDTTRTMVKTALANGYVLLDTAKQYGNEAGVGAGIQDAITAGIVNREQIFLTTKIFNGDQGDYDRVVAVLKANSRISKQTMSTCCWSTGQLMASLMKRGGPWKPS